MVLARAVLELDAPTVRHAATVPALLESIAQDFSVHRIVREGSALLEGLKGSTCSVCLDDEEDDTALWVRLKRCGHAFHTKCMQEHLNGRTLLDLEQNCRDVDAPFVVNCPLCRADLFDN